MIYYLIPLLIASYLLFVFFINRSGSLRNDWINIPDHRDDIKHAPKSLTIGSWNIGFAGMWEESDFIADGGKRFRAPSRKHVEENLDGILELIDENLSSDILLLQEITSMSPINYNVNIENRLQDKLDSFFYAFYPVVQSFFISILL